jgi:hypothetical protein
MTFGTVMAASELPGIVVNLRRSRRWRWMTDVLCLPPLAAVLSLSAFSSSARVATLRASFSSADVPASCTATALSAQQGPAVSEATGQHTLDVRLTNISHSTCVLDGYPVVSLLDAHGHALDFTYSHKGDQMTTSASPSPVYLPPKGRAWARINKYRCDIASTDTAYTVVFELPHHGGTLSMGKTQYPVFDYCQQRASLSVAVSPFEPVAPLLSPPTEVEKASPPRRGPQ